MDGDRHRKAYDDQDGLPDHERPILEPQHSRAEHIDTAQARGGGRMLEMINIALDHVEKAGGTVNMPCSEGTVEDMVSRVLRRATERGLLVEVRRTAKTVHISPPKAEPFAELQAFAREHGVPALLDHLGLDDLGNEVNTALGAVRRHDAPDRPRRQVDMTFGLHLAGDDVSVATEAVVAAVKNVMLGREVRVPTPFIVTEVDDPIHLHSVRSGSR